MIWIGENDIPPEALIPKYVLQELCSESAKLKTLGAMESIPSNKIIRLLSILEKNIRDGAKVSPIADPVWNNINKQHYNFMSFIIGWFIF